MTESKIEWTDRSDWNPIRGCTRVSPGCGGPGPHGGCYAEAMAARFSKPGMWGHGIAEMKEGKPRWTGKVELQEDRITLPLKWRKPARIFVSSTSDLFHEALPDEAIDKIFAVMALCPQHTFQVLTKRAARMPTYFLGDRRYRDVHPMEDHINRIADAAGRLMEDGDNAHDYVLNRDWPLSNVWLGVSTERQQEADERIPLLLQTPAAVRFISAEPLLGPIELYSLGGSRWVSNKSAVVHDALAGFRSDQVHTPKLDWVIVGGESGRGARPMHIDWDRSLRDQCAAAGVPFFKKQWGEWLPWSQFNGAGIEDDPEQTRFATREWDGERWNDVGRPMWCETADGEIDDEQCVGRVGKARAGRLLDGVEHNTMPKA